MHCENDRSMSKFYILRSKYYAIIDHPIITILTPFGWRIAFILQVILSQLGKRKRSANLGKLLKTIKGRKKVFTMVKNQFAFVSFKTLTSLASAVDILCGRF